MPLANVNFRLALKSILFTTDFSPASEAALPYATALARWYGSRLVIVHSVAPEPMLAVPMEPMPADMDLDWKSAQNKMDALLANPTLEGMAHDSVVQHGELWDVISSVVSKQPIDLIVLGTHGRGGLKKLVMGSAAEQIFRRARCPVLTVGPQASQKAVAFENWRCILFATDFSAGSLNALPYALSLAEENQASLILLHLIPLMPVEQQEEVLQSARERLQLLIPPEATAWCKPEYLVGFDFPAEGILRTAEQRGADLIVMGVRAAGAPRVTAHLPWAIAHEVVCHAHCPVLTVRG